MQGNRDVVTDCRMRTILVVVSTPILQLFLRVCKCHADATEDELCAERAVAQSQTVRSFERRRPSRKPFPEHLPRERVVIAAPESCACCGATKLSKLGEGVTETLEVIPLQWKVIRKRIGEAVRLGRPTA